MQASNYTLTYFSNGTVARGSSSMPGYPQTLAPGDLLLSDTFSRAGCLQVGLSPSSPGIGGFVSTYDDVIGTTTRHALFSSPHPLQNTYDDQSLEVTSFGSQLRCSSSHFQSSLWSQSSHTLVPHRGIIIRVQRSLVNTLYKCSI